MHLAHAKHPDNVWVFPPIQLWRAEWGSVRLVGDNAPMEVEDSWKTSVRLATLDADGPTGGFFHEGDTLPW